MTEIALKNPYLVVVIALATVVLGVTSLPRDNEKRGALDFCRIHLDTANVGGE